MEISSIIEEIDNYESLIRDQLSLILSNLVMIGEVPAPTFKEFSRSSILAERLALQENVTTRLDEIGNVIGFYPGMQSNRNILIGAHVDSPLASNIDHTVEIGQERIVGASLGDNALSCAVMATLPDIFKAAKIELQSNLIFLGSVQSLGKGSNEGIRTFLSDFKEPIASAILLEGGPQGRISYNSVGMLRGEIVSELPESYDWSRLHSEGALETIIGIVRRIQGIPLPTRPKTTIVFGSLEGGGLSFDKVTNYATLRFEIRSESAHIVHTLRSAIQDIVDEEESKTRSLITFHQVVRRFPGGLDYSHPLNQAIRHLLKHFDITPRDIPSTSDLSTLIEKKIPGILFGLTKVETVADLRQSIEIEPLIKGIQILVGLILAIDREHSDGT